MRRLQHGARDLGLCLTSEHLTAFGVYYDELITWNRRFNLTAVTDREEVQYKHFLDSLTCLLVLPDVPANVPIPNTVPLSSGVEAAWRCIDVGTGAGFPGLPLKILRPRLQLTLLEATGKKTVFLRELVAKLGLEGVEVIHGRAEELGQEAEYRERYDVAVARAVASLQVLVEYCLPFCGVGGRFIAQKSTAGLEDELAAAGEAIQVLGGCLREVKPIKLPGLEPERCLVAIDKVGSTPAKYPRRPGMPVKRPLA
jgi:16S rRNA (guanine527-N7)-methyltransferase